MNIENNNNNVSSNESYIRVELTENVKKFINDGFKNEDYSINVFEPIPGWVSDTDITRAVEKTMRQWDDYCKQESTDSDDYRCIIRYAEEVCSRYDIKYDRWLLGTVTKSIQHIFKKDGETIYKFNTVG